MKVILIQPPIEDFYSTPIRFYPLGLLYAARVLQHVGCDVEVLDTLTLQRKRQLPYPADFEYLKPYFENNPLLFNGYYRFGLDDDAIISKVNDSQADLVGISSNFTAYFGSVARLAQRLKAELDVPLFVGGHHATAFANEIKQKCSAIDYVLSGPAEDAIPAMLSTVYNMSGEKMDWQDLMPAHELVSGDNYQLGRKNIVSLTATRGCPYKCEFCSIHNMFGRKMEYREPHRVLSEMQWCYKQKDTRIFNFEDDNLSFNQTWFEQLLDLIRSDRTLKDIELSAMNGLSISLLNPPLLEKMADAGFRYLNLSLVTQDRELRANLNRPHHSDLEKVVKTAHHLNLVITVHIILGLPGQTYDEIKASIDYLYDLGVRVGPSVFYIPPASEIYKNLNVPATILSNWNYYRSSAFAIETEQLTRDQLIELFVYACQKYLIEKERSKSHASPY